MKNQNFRRLLFGRAMVYGQWLLLSVALLMAPMGCKLFGGVTSGEKDDEPQVIDTLDRNPPPNPIDTTKDTSKVNPPADSTLVLPPVATQAGLWLDSTYTLTWDSTKPPQSAGIRLAFYRDDGFLLWVTAMAPNSGRYVLDFADLLKRSGYRFGSGSRYRLRLTSLEYSSYQALSPYFNLRSRYQGSLKVTSPTGDSTGYFDSTLTVAWDKTGETGPAAGIQLLADSGKSLMLGLDLPNSGSWIWSDITTGFGTGDHFRIRVFSLADPSMTDTSVAFRLAPPIAPVLRFDYPVAGDSLKAGDTAYLAWHADRKFRSVGRLDLYRDTTLMRRLDTTIIMDSGKYVWRLDPTLGQGSYRLRLKSLTSDWGGYSENFMVLGWGHETFESDDSLHQAKDIAVNGEVIARLAVAGDQDWMRFEAKTNKYYVAAVDAPTAMTLTLLDSLGTPIIAAKTGKNVQSFFWPDRNGTFFIKVDGALVNTAYTVRLREYEWQPTLIQTVFQSPISTTNWTTGISQLIAWQPDTLIYGSSVKLDLFRDTTLVNNIVPAFLNRGSLAWTPPTTLVTSNRYRLRIMHATDSRIHAYSDYFSIQGITLDAYEPDNTRDQAKSILAQDTLQARSLASANPDWVGFEVKAGHQYFVNVESKTYTVTASLYHADGSLIQTQSGTRFVLYSPSLVPGKYTMQLTTAMIQSIDYKLRLFEVGKWSGGLSPFILSPDSASVWKSGEAATMTWTKDTAALGTYVGLALYQDTSLFLSLTGTATNSGQYSYILPANMASGNNYRLRLVGSLQSNLWGFSPFFSVTGVEPDAFEPDPGKSSAKLLKVETPHAKNLTYNDQDWSRITVSPDSIYVVTVKSSATMISYITDSLDNILSSMSGTHFHTPIRPTASGTIFVRNFASTGTTALTYQLSLTTYGAYSQGLPVTFVAPDTTAVWAAGSAYPVQWSVDTGFFNSGVSLSLYRDTTLVQSLASSSMNTGSATVTPVAGLPSSGNYRLRLANSNYPNLFAFSHPFTISGIRADDYEPNDQASAATILTSDSIRLPLSHTYQDRDWFRFTAKAQYLYRFRTYRSGANNQILSIWSANGQSQILSTTASSFDSLQSLPFYSATAGEYWFSVQPYSSLIGNLGEYELDAQELSADDYRFAFSMPEADSSYTTSTVLPITWTDPAGLKGRVDIFLYSAQGVVQTLVTDAVNSGTYSWAIPSTLPARNDYTIRVVSRWNTALYGVSPAFSVVRP